MKNSAFELGGSDPFIVLEDADLDLAVIKARSSRLITNGQACNAAKRFIISEKVYDDFKQKLKTELENWVKVGDPLNTNTTIGPLVSQKAKDQISGQIKDSVS